MLKNKISLIILGIIFIFTLLLSFISIYNIKTFEKNILEESYKVTINNIKRELINYTDIIHQNINNLHKLYSINPHEITKKETDKLFLNYMIPIYEKYKNDPNIKEILLDIIKSYRYKISPFGKKDGFFTVIDEKSLKILVHKNPECIGKKIKNLKKEQLLKNIDQIYQGFFKIECEGEEKFLFIKYFRPFNWIITTVISKKEIDITEKVIYNIIKNIRFDNENYFFGYKVEGKDFIYVFHPYLSGKLDLSQTDVKGKFFKKELISKALNGGGFTTYYFKNLATNNVEQKLTYSIYYPKLNLIIAVGTYITDINKKIASMKEEIKSAVVKESIQILIFSIIILLISFVIFQILISKFLTEPLNELNKAIEAVKNQEFSSDKEIDNIAESFAIFTQKVERQLKEIIDHLKRI